MSDSPTPTLPVSGSDAPLDRLGRPLHDLRISVTDRCNFRCGYCMPHESFPASHKFLPTDKLLSFDEIERLARLFVSALGVSKLRITGGEPLMRPELPQLIERLAKLEGVEDLALTTNASLLDQHARALASAGLKRITVSLDSLNPVEFADMSGIERKLERVLAGIDAALEAGLGPLKINCVVVRGRNESAILDLTERFRGTPHVVRFIEYMDVGTQNGWNVRDVVASREILQRVGIRWPLTAASPTYRGEVASRYRYLDGAGEIGVISSVTAPFCGDCHRARLSADGRLLTCLFAADGTDLRAQLRDGASDTSLLETLREVWSARTDRYSEEREASAGDRPQRRRLEMYQIGG